MRDALDSARVPLAAAGCETPRLDAELLLAHALGVDRARLLLEPDAEVAGAAARAFQTLVMRRRRREPVAHLLGRQGFRHLELEVDGRVLVPRPETETLVEAALDLPAGSRVLDVGTGSGAVALALKHERGDLEVAGSDASADALAVARRNVARLGLDVALHHAAGIDAVPGGPYDAVVSNPPYVADSDALPPDVQDYEPAQALRGGPDGLAVARVLARELNGVRWAAFEVGAGQAGAVGSLLHEAGFAELAVRRDLAGIERVVLGVRSMVDSE